jgi:hypothetical protein
LTELKARREERKMNKFMNSREDSLVSLERDDHSQQDTQIDKITSFTLQKFEASKSAMGFYPGPDLGNTRYRADKAPSGVGLLLGGSATRLPKI